MRFLIVILLITVASCKAGQNEPFDCDAFLAQKIVVTENTDLDSLLNEFQKFKKCGISEDDAGYLLSGQIIGVTMVELTNENGSDFTYGDMLNSLLEKKNMLKKAK